MKPCHWDSLLYIAILTVRTYRRARKYLVVHLQCPSQYSKRRDRWDCNIEMVVTGGLRSIHRANPSQTDGAEQNEMTHSACLDCCLDPIILLSRARQVNGLHIRQLVELSTWLLGAMASTSSSDEVSYIGRCVSMTFPVRKRTSSG